MPAPKRAPSPQESQPKIRKLDDDGDDLPSKTAPADINNSLKTGNAQEKSAVPRTKKKLSVEEEGDQSPTNDSSKNWSDPPFKKAKLLHTTSASCEQTSSQKANSKAPLKRSASTDSDEETSSDGSKLDLFREGDDGDKAHCIRQYANKVKALHKAEELPPCTEDNSHKLTSASGELAHPDLSCGIYSDLPNVENRGENHQEVEKESAVSADPQRRGDRDDAAECRSEETSASASGSCEAAVSAECGAKDKKLEEFKNTEMQHLYSITSGENGKNDETDSFKNEDEDDGPRLHSAQTQFSGTVNPICDGEIHTIEITSSRCRAENETAVGSGTKTTELVTEDMITKREGESVEETCESASVSAQVKDAAGEEKMSSTKGNTSPDEIPAENLSPESQTDLSVKIQLTFKEKSKPTQMSDQVSDKTTNSVSNVLQMSEESERKEVEFHSSLVLTNSGSIAGVQLSPDETDVKTDSCTDMLTPGCEELQEQRQINQLADSVAASGSQIDTDVQTETTSEGISDPAPGAAAQNQNDNKGDDIRDTDTPAEGGENVTVETTTRLENTTAFDCSTGQSVQSRMDVNISNPASAVETQSQGEADTQNQSEQRRGEYTAQIPEKFHQEIMSENSETSAEGDTKMEKLPITTSDVASPSSTVEEKAELCPEVSQPITNLSDKSHAHSFVNCESAELQDAVVDADCGTSSENQPDVHPTTVTVSQELSNVERPQYPPPQDVVEPTTDMFDVLHEEPKADDFTVQENDNHINSEPVSTSEREPNVEMHKVSTSENSNVNDLVELQKTSAAVEMKAQDVCEREASSSTEAQDQTTADTYQNVTNLQMLATSASGIPNVASPAGGESPKCQKESDVDMETTSAAEEAPGLRNPENSEHFTDVSRDRATVPDNQVQTEMQVTSTSDFSCPEHEVELQSQKNQENTGSTQGRSEEVQVDECNTSENQVVTETETHTTDTIEEIFNTTVKEQKHQDECRPDEGVECQIDSNMEDDKEGVFSEKVGDLESQREICVAATSDSAPLVERQKVDTNIYIETEIFGTEQNEEVFAAASFEAPEIHGNTETAAVPGDNSISAPAVDQQQDLRSEIVPEHSLLSANLLQKSHSDLGNMVNTPGEFQKDVDTTSGSIEAVNAASEEELGEQMIYEAREGTAVVPDDEAHGSVGSTESTGDGTGSGEVIVLVGQSDVSNSVSLASGEQMKMSDRAEMQHHENDIVYEPISSPESNDDRDLPAVLEKHSGMSILDIQDTETQQFIKGTFANEVSHTGVEDEESGAADGQTAAAAGEVEEMEVQSNSVSESSPPVLSEQDTVQDQETCQETSTDQENTEICNLRAEDEDDVQGPLVSVGQSAASVDMEVQSTAVSETCTSSNLEQSNTSEVPELHSTEDQELLETVAENDEIELPDPPVENEELVEEQTDSQTPTTTVNVDVQHICEPEPLVQCSVSNTLQPSDPELMKEEITNTPVSMEESVQEEHNDSELQTAAPSVDHRGSISMSASTETQRTGDLSTDVCETQGQNQDLSRTSEGQSPAAPVDGEVQNSIESETCSTAQLEEIKTKEDVSANEENSEIIDALQEVLEEEVQEHAGILDSQVTTGVELESHVSSLSETSSTAQLNNIFEMKETETQQVTENTPINEENTVGSVQVEVEESLQEQVCVSDSETATAVEMEVQNTTMSETAPSAQVEQNHMNNALDVNHGLDTTGIQQIIQDTCSDDEEGQDRETQVCVNDGGVTVAAVATEVENVAVSETVLSAQLEHGSKQDTNTVETEQLQGDGSTDEQKEKMPNEDDTEQQTPAAVESEEQKTSVEETSPTEVQSMETDLVEEAAANDEQNQEIYNQHVETEEEKVLEQIFGPSDEMEVQSSMESENSPPVQSEQSKIHSHEDQVPTTSSSDNFNLSEDGTVKDGTTESPSSMEFSEPRTQEIVASPEAGGLAPPTVQAEMADGTSEEYVILEPVPDSEIPFDIVTQAVAQSGLNISLPQEEKAAEEMCDVIGVDTAQMDLVDAELQHTYEDCNTVQVENAGDPLVEDVQILQDIEIGREVVVAEEDNVEDGDVTIIEKQPETPQEAPSKEPDEKKDETPKEDDSGTKVQQNSTADQKSEENQQPV
ncbi:uncharacterized protein LOC103377424 isoform X2 [Cynoglossus semilaevis]|uniref:uncharacterized protein LOC103377424 isoform X2 n=1 Tax=Cynoglossus semilaevis TaxID=244447 RepID=UPI000D62B810|nr:uncharacterized protein LOC103377424 isoform X2 [Cynoglossus semilaevis]